MNNKKRKQLKDANDLLDAASQIIDSVLNDEEMCMENMPESLQESDRYYAMENVVDILSSVLDDISSVQDDIQSAME